VQHTGATGDGERRSVATGVQPLARRLDPDERDALVGDEAGEHPDRIRSAPDACDHTLGQPSGRPQDLRARLVADDALQVAHERGIRRRADAGADDVMRRLDIRHPVADRGGGRLLQRAGTGLDGRDLGAEQAHALDVGLLAAHVLGAHEDDALELEQRTRGRGGDAVLAGAGLGDDPPLAHPQGEQRLAERVVDLVGAGVVEVLALEVDRVAGRLREPAGVVQRRGPADVITQQRRELVDERGIGASGQPGLLELGERRHQRLRDVLAAVGAEAMLDDAHAASWSELTGDTADAARASSGSGAVAATAAANACSAAWSLTPGADSVPLATSTA
jgi:hypothetical protein